MREGDEVRYQDAMGALFEHWGRAPSKIALQGFWGALEHVEIEGVERAVAKAIGECEFLPSGKRLAELAQDGPGAVEAWDAVTTAIQRLGRYQWETAKEQLGHRVWDATATVGGFRYLCGLSIQDLDRVGRGDFARAYASGDPSRRGQLPDGVDAEPLGPPRADGLTRALPGGGAMPT